MCHSLKSELRRVYRTKMLKLAASEITVRSQEIAANFFNSFDLTNVSMIHLFLPIVANKEVDTSLIYEKIWRDYPEIRTVVPRLNLKIGEIESLEFTAESQLKKNEWQILEPIGTGLIDPAGIDLVITPLLIFDEKGNRVGYGKGYYDRFFSTCRPNCLKIGLSFFPPIKSISDTNKNDVKLNYSVTPSNIWKF